MMMQRNLILDQKQLTHLRGSCGPWGNMADNGCGTVALYNLLQLLDVPVSYERLHSHVQKHWFLATLAGGLLGMNPVYLFSQIRRRTGARLRLHIYLGGKTPGWMPVALQTAVPAREPHLSPPVRRLFLNLYLYRFGAHYSVTEYKDGGWQIYNDTTNNSPYPDYYRSVKACGMLVAEVMPDRKTEILS
jgi:hypothetical protein